MIRLLLMVLRSPMRNSWVFLHFTIFILLSICLIEPPSVLSATLAGKVEVIGEYSIRPRKNLEERIKAERSLVVSGGGGLKNAVVFIRGPKANNSLPKGTVIDQRNKTFLPHVLPIPVGATVTFKNSDPFVHRIISDSEAKRLRMEFAYEGAAMEVTFDKPGTVELWCDDHKRMQTWVLVMDTPFFAITDEEGYYNIPNLPGGKYTVEVWHETLAAESQEIEIKERENTWLDFRIPGKEF